VYLRGAARGKRREVVRPDVPGGDVVAWGMDKKEINSTKMTVNFLVWIGGVFMLLLFALLAHFVWRLF
jgi:hypothetical protein